ncbi:unnamed protein product [Amoebophrya sp. A25]|nr:unnamed protein product [Amoebophrya sp. A25]|eukprot:GSA25T00016978001.1
MSGFIDDLSAEQSAALAGLEKELGTSEWAQTSLWQCNLGEKSDARDIILLKFLRAEEFDIAKAWTRFNATMQWRRDGDVDSLADATLPAQFQGHDIFHGHDVQQKRPVLTSHFGNMDLDKVFSDTDVFVKYRIHIMERAIRRLLPFGRDKPETLYQVHDYKDCPVVFKDKAVDRGVKAISKVLGDHYPEFKGRTCFVNFPGIVALAWKAAALLIVSEKTANKMDFLGYQDLLPLLADVPPSQLSDRLIGLADVEKGTFSTEGSNIQEGVLTLESRSGEIPFTLGPQQSIYVRLREGAEKESVLLQSASANGETLPLRSIVEGAQQDEMLQMAVPLTLRYTSTASSEIPFVLNLWDNSTFGLSAKTIVYAAEIK